MIALILPILSLLIFPAVAVAIAAATGARFD